MEKISTSLGYNEKYLLEKISYDDFKARYGKSNYDTTEHKNPEWAYHPEGLGYVICTVFFGFTPIKFKIIYRNIFWVSESEFKERYEKDF